MMRGPAEIGVLPIKSVVPTAPITPAEVCGVPGGLVVAIAGSGFAFRKATAKSACTQNCQGSLTARCSSTIGVTSTSVVTAGDSSTVSGSTGVGLGNSNSFLACGSTGVGLGNSKSLSGV